MCHLKQKTIPASLYLVLFLENSLGSRNPVNCHNFVNESAYIPRSKDIPVGKESVEDFVQVEAGPNGQLSTRIDVRGRHSVSH